MALEIMKIDVDHLTGHTTAQVRVVEVVNNQTSHGPLETIGIDHQSLTGKFACHAGASDEEVQAALVRWLAEHHAGALARKQAMDQRAGVIQNLAGRVLSFTEAS